MNYRHAYHAGNFADVLKHIILARVITYLTQKAQPFRVIDTHAGAGLYDLTGVEAGKTGEWHDGIGRLIDEDVPDNIAPLIAPYLSAVRSVNAAGTLQHYPGSPLIARHLMRSTDALIANELHPDENALLKSALKGAPETKVLNLDAWHAIKSLLPPKERRGVILIDPPFEKPDEFDALSAALTEGLRRFATGIFLAWFPVKSVSEVSSFLDTQRRAGKILEVRLRIATPEPGLGLAETGVLIVNPPFTLKAELEKILSILSPLLAESSGARFTVT